MKTRTMVALCGSALAAEVIAGLMYTIKGLLPSIATKVLITILVIAGLTALYCIIALIKRIHGVITDIRLKHLEHQEREQRMLQESERHELEMLSLRADIHVKLSRLYADPNGNYPVLLPGQFLAPAEMTGNVLMLPPGQAKGIGTRSVAVQSIERLPDKSEQGGRLPTNVRYEDIRDLIPHGHVLVGIGQSGIETKDQAVGACLWIVGLSGTGKTSTTVLRVEERAADKHVFLGADPHWFKDDSLFHAIYETLDGQPGPYASRFALPMACTDEELNTVLRTFWDEFHARKAGQRAKPFQKVTLIVDEVTSIMDLTGDEENELRKENAALLKSIARICGQEARNFLMGGIFISQQATGLAWLAKVALMVIVHQLLREAEKKLATNNDPIVMKEMKTWPIGRTYVYGVGFQEGPRTVQQPYFSPGGYDAGEKILPDENDQIEDEQSGFYQSTETALPITKEPHFEEGQDGEYGAFSGDFDAEKETEGKVLTFPENGASRLVERSDCKTDARLKPTREYRFTETEIVQFVAAYRAVGNIEKVLGSMKKGSGYKPHARELIQAFNLKRDA